jgi:acetoin utilization protein AcuB
MSTTLITVTRDDTILKAYTLLTQNRIRQLPVCEDSHIIGIITDRDIRQAFGQRLDGQSEENLKAIGLEKKKVADYMSPKPVVIAPETPVEVAVQLIRTKKFGSLPVCDSNNKLIGIVTITDISGLLLKLLQNGS